MIRTNNNKNLTKRLRPIRFNIGDSPNNKETSNIETEALTYTEELENMIDSAGLYCERIPKVKLPTNKEVFENGKIVDDWPCDMNAQDGTQESNGGIENVITYKGKIYNVITSWYINDEQPKHIYRANEPADVVGIDYMENKDVLSKLKEEGLLS